MQILIARLLAKFGRFALSFVVVFLILIGANWVWQGASELLEQERVLKKSAAEQAQAQSSLKEAEKSLSQTREKHVDSLRNSYLAQHRRLVRTVDEQLQLWNDNPVFVRMPWTEAGRNHEILKVRRATEEGLLESIYVTWKWASGDFPNQRLPSPEKLREMQKSVPEIAKRIAEIEGAAESTRQLREEVDRITDIVDQARSGIQESKFRWLRDHVFSSDAKQVVAALTIVLTSMFMPWIIRSFFYFVLAPAASRCHPFRLTGDGAAPVDATRSVRFIGESAPSLPVVIEMGQCLAVVADYVNGAPHDADRRTRWLLDGRHPLTSLAAGIFPLEDIQGDGRSVVLASMKDPLLELARIRIPEGAAMVFRPRALVGVIHPTGRPPRITSHWRLGSLHAWLTLQMRYLVFHGPVDLIAKGCRGIRTESTSGSFAIRQDATVGYSAEALYSTSRDKPAYPYLNGTKHLFLDRFEGEGGLVAYEVVPRRDQDPGKATSVVQGATDALMSAFGI